MVIVGFAGGVGCELMLTLAEAGEVHPEEFVTVKLCVPVDSPVIDVLTVLPEIEPGFIVQLPEGRPLRTTLPVAVEQVGCVITPTAGVVGNALTVTAVAAEAADVQPAALVT